MGFLLNKSSFFSERGLFLNHHYNTYLSREDKMFVRAYEVNFEKRSENLKKVFGEFFEREVLINNNNSKTEYINTVSLIDGQPKKVKKSKIIAVDEFVDSSGMASHLSSFELLKSSFLEFFERQSLIISFLAKKINYEVKIDSNNIIDNYLKNYIDETKYYDISLSNEVYVIITIGYGSDKCVGLGTSFDIYEAIKKSQLEALQYFATSKTKFYKKQSYVETNTEKDHYHESFDKLSVAEFKHKYHYMLKTNNFINVIDLKKYKTGTLESLIKDSHDNLKMNPHICFLNSHRTISHLKIARIIDDQWFPHINPSLYENDKLENLSEILKINIRQEKYIPFP